MRELEIEWRYAARTVLVIASATAQGDDWSVVGSVVMADMNISQVHCVSTEAQQRRSAAVQYLTRSTGKILPTLMAHGLCSRPFVVIDTPRNPILSHPIPYHPPHVSLAAHRHGRPSPSLGDRWLRL